MPKDAERGPRMFELSVAGLPGESDTRYFVQLPPEYDPLRHYPTIVALADARRRPSRCSTSGRDRSRRKRRASGSARRRGTDTS